MKLRHRVIAVAVIATSAMPGIATTPSAGAEPPSPGSPIALTGPAKIVVDAYEGEVYDDFGLNLTAGDEAFEVRSRRADWKSPINTYWQSSTGRVTLPEQTAWDGLKDFVNVAFVRAKDGKLVRTRHLDVCLNSWNTQRTTPDAELRSPYPEGCPQSPFTLGSVQGIQGKWVTGVGVGDRALKLPPATYDVTARITPAYAKALGLKRTDAVRTYRLVVRNGDNAEVAKKRASAAGTRTPSVRSARPAARPTAARAGAPGDAVPDLRSLPAFGMDLTANSRYLRFSATVWNAGNGPMVVDGFRRGTSDVMDAYQYFIDAQGNQTGYQKVGTMIWHSAASHNHWHFKDFAKYSLLNADLSEVVVSRKESFCLANTDAVNYTVAGADWQPDNTDLHTACGDRNSVSLREVLASGSGDTYAQFRAGQAFRIDNLPNGIYYVAVEGNPNRNLVESNTTNNRALRKIKLSGTPTKRRLTVYRVGVIDDTGYGHEDEEH